MVVRQDSISMATINLTYRETFLENTRTEARARTYADILLLSRPGHHLDE
jgi:hypothetical protein